MIIHLRQDLWNTDRIVDFSLPGEWNVEILSTGGDRKRILGDDEIRTALAVVGPMLKGKGEICVLFDDLSRPTRAYRIVPHLLGLFREYGVRDDQVRFLCSLGTHAPHTNRDFRRKLGPEVLERFPVYNHNPYENCDRIGETRLGTPVSLNREYLSCDLRIGIGTFLPHQFCGFGGGYKIVMPGISHIDSIIHHHGTLLAKHWETCYGLGKYRDNILLDDIREAGRIAGLDVKIDVMVNSSAEATDIFAGDPDELYEVLAPKAIPHYSARARGKADVVFANAFGKGNEAVISLSIAEAFLKDEGGDIVVVCDIEEGQVLHYLLGRFGKDVWGRLAFKEREKSPKVGKIYIYSRYRDIVGGFWFGKGHDLEWHDDPSTLVGTLEEKYRGRAANVLVIPDGTILMPSL